MYYACDKVHAVFVPNPGHAASFVAFGVSRLTEDIWVKRLLDLAQVMHLHLVWVASVRKGFQPELCLLGHLRIGLTLCRLTLLSEVLYLDL